MSLSFHRRVLCATALAVALATSQAAHADGLASPWDKGFHSKARLTAATLLGSSDAMALFAGVDIRLDKNWKTYWKSPGDGGGIPPEFDWSASQNVADIKVMYPLPKLLKDAYGYSIGYKDGVLFPVAVTPITTTAPVKLRLKVHFGVCDDICIPAEAELKLDVPPNARAAIPVQRDLLTAMQRVPTASQSSVRLSSAEARLADARPHLLFRVSAPVTASQAALFVTSRDGDTLPMAQTIGRDADGTTTFRIDLGHMSDPRALVGKTLDLTIGADQHGIEVPWTVAAAG